MFDDFFFSIGDVAVPATAKRVGAGRRLADDG